MNGITAYALSAKYTDITVEGGGSLKGAPCQIDRIEDIEGGHRVHFKWELNDGTVLTDTLDVMNGLRGERGERGEQGLPGKDGFAPQVTVKASTDTDYVLNIEDVDSDYDTPNLKGTGVVTASYDAEDENVTIR